MRNSNHRRYQLMEGNLEPSPTAYLFLYCSHHMNLSEACIPTYSSWVCAETFADLCRRRRTSSCGRKTVPSLHCQEVCQDSCLNFLPKSRITYHQPSRQHACGVAEEKNSATTKLNHLCPRPFSWSYFNRCENNREPVGTGHETAAGLNRCRWKAVS